MHGTATWPVNDPGTYSYSNRAFVFLLVSPSSFLFLLLSFSLFYVLGDKLVIPSTSDLGLWNLDPDHLRLPSVSASDPKMPVESSEQYIRAM
jgi:hypothetical protein